jgi:hypothetical protein
MYRRELSRPSTCALGLAIADMYVNSFILDEGALEKTNSPTRYIPNHSNKTLSITPNLESICLKINNFKLHSGCCVFTFLMDEFV